MLIPGINTLVNRLQSQLSLNLILTYSKNLGPGRDAKTISLFHHSWAELHISDDVRVLHHH